MIEVPNEVRADSFLTGQTLVSENLGPNGRQAWHIAKPLRKTGLCFRLRLRLAWKVFTGQLDVIHYWESGK